MIALARCLGGLALIPVIDGARHRKQPSFAETQSALATSCGFKGANAMSSGPNMSIVNGDNADECEWRWQVGIMSAGKTQPSCGGTLITPEWVLTAAHCSYLYNIQIVAGEYDTSRDTGTEQRRMVDEIVRHPEYDDRTVHADYALFHLESPVNVNGCVGTACLPTGSDVPVGTDCYITGWGTLSSGGRQPRTLQEGKVEVISNYDCVNKFGYKQSEIDETMLCAQGNTGKGGYIDACQGDSGGPLVCRTSGAWTLYGATSWGHGCADRNFPGIYARVHYVMDWVNAVLDGTYVAPKPPGECPSYCEAFLCFASDCAPCDYCN